MYYSLIGLLALLTLVITNYDVLFIRRNAGITRVHKIYRLFLISVILYYVSDILWGAFEALSMIEFLYADTEIYFLAMALGILFWTKYVTAYLQNNNGFRRFLRYSGNVFFAGVTTATFINLVSPVMFYFDHDGVYHPGPARYVTLIVQITLLFLTSVYVLFVYSKSGNQVKCRYLIVGLSGLIMLLFIFIQIFYPYLPLYAIGYMLSCCLLRTMVVENEREEYRMELEVALHRERQHIKELDTAWRLAYTDSLTGAKSPLAFSEMVAQYDEVISRGNPENFAVLVFDVNGLKHINDTLGHATGDEYIVSAFRIISNVFVHSSVYRVGGDEFVSILEKEDYSKKNDLMDMFNYQIEKNIENGSVVIAAGMADYIHGTDNSFKRVFQRADRMMYERKKELKKSEPV
jgi:diguanylate cyclase (GGDEF)-like protein